MLLKNQKTLQALSSNLTVKRDSIALKAEVDELGINKLINVPINLNNLKTKVYDLDVDKFNSVPVPVDLKKRVMQRVIMLVKRQCKTS